MSKCTGCNKFFFFGGGKLEVLEVEGNFQAFHSKCCTSNNSRRVVRGETTFSVSDLIESDSQPSLNSINEPTERTADEEISEGNYYFREDGSFEYYSKKLNEMNVLASFWLNEGNYELAEELYRNCYDFILSKQGPKHQETAYFMDCLGEVYFAQEILILAEEFFKSAYELRKEILGAENRDTLTSMNSLANVYMSMSKFDEALPLFEECLSIRSRVFGDTDPGTLRTKNCLGNFYYHQCQISKSREDFLKSKEYLELCVDEYTRINHHQLYWAKENLETLNTLWYKRFGFD